MDFLQLAKDRYSCRKFSGQRVEAEKIEKMIEAGLAAPTAVNKQPFRIWVMDSPGLTEKIARTTKFTFQAEQFLLVGAKADEAWVRQHDQKNFAEVDAAIAATHIMMEAQQLGVGTTWVGHFDEGLFKELIPELQGYELIALFPLGYPSDEAKPAGLHYKCREKEELVKYL